MVDRSEHANRHCQPRQTGWRRALGTLRARPRLVLLSGAALALVAASNDRPSSAGVAATIPTFGQSGDFTVMTYNVKGLPWPVAWGREEDLRRIGDRLAALRERGLQPHVVVLQEAFIDDAKAIGNRAGYRYRLTGPSAGSAVSNGRTKISRSWYLGETQAKQLDSGLVVLSDFPIRKARRAPFPADACAGFDCLAAKGVALVTLELPGGNEVAVATTHFNSRGASRAPGYATNRAYAQQSVFLAKYLEREWSERFPLIVAGDFNVGQRRYRQQVLTAALADLNNGERPAEAFRVAMKRDGRFERSADARAVRDRARDMQYLFDGRDLTLEPVGASIPFGTEPEGTALSDHTGFTVHYRVVAVGPAARRESLMAQ